jgi:hypothetical protein
MNPHVNDFNCFILFFNCEVGLLADADVFPRLVFISCQQNFPKMLQRNEQNFPVYAVYFKG